jgi:hypothetical protein
VRVGRFAVALSLALVPGCEDIVTEVSVSYLLPEDDTPLQPTNNVSLTLSPDGFSETFSVDGPDFSVEVELEPDDAARSLSVFMARNENLLGYGITPPFSYTAASGVALRVFISYPGTLTTFPAQFDVPDDSTLAAPARGRGLIALGGDGSTLYIDAYTHDLLAAEPLEPDEGLPDPADGTLVGNASGNVDRLLWNEGLSGYRFSVLANRWDALELAGGGAAGPRPGAIGLAANDGTEYVLLGGGDRLDVVRIDLNDPAQQVELHPRWALDRARPGATASWLRLGDRAPEPIIFGASDDAPVVYFPARGRAFGPAGPWTQGRCVQVDAPTADPIRILCAGGQRADAPTADAVLIAVGTIEAPRTEERVAFLPAAMADPLWLEDERAVYAQGGGRFVRVGRGVLAIEEPAASVFRAAGGQTVPFDTTVTFLVGGVDSNGQPVTQWQVFTPDLR